MLTNIEQELGLGPVVHRMRRWVATKTKPNDQLSLDPLTVNYEAWRSVRRHVRSWPHYVEAPNSLEILVSLEDWEDYWGVDTQRKEEGIAAYVHARAVDRGYWMAGEPQVLVLPDDAIEVGQVEVSCQFLEADDGEGLDDADSTASREPLVADPPREEVEQTPDASSTPTTRFVHATEQAEACLVGKGGFRLVVHAGDCIGAVRPGEVMPAEVNVRLDAEGFPYVEAKQCTLDVADGRWTITNHSAHGTCVILRDGRRLMLGEPEPYALAEGDVLCLGTERRLRFELV